MNGKETAYRGVRETDRLEPGKVILTRPVHRVRKLREGDPVRRGQLLALVNPCKMLDDVAGRLVKLPQDPRVREARSSLHPLAHRHPP